MIQVPYDTVQKLVNSGKYRVIEGVDVKTMMFKCRCCDEGDQELVPAISFENGIRMLKRLHHANKPGVRCGNCGGAGSKLVDEGYGPLVQDACYHCANTGEISRETWEKDRLQHAASVLAGDLTDNAERSANSNPDGEGFAFHAAENGMHAYEYRQCLYFNNEGRAMEAMGDLWNKHRSVAEVLVERLVPAPKPKFGYGETKVMWHETTGLKTGLAIRFDEPTASYLVEMDDKFMWIHQDTLSATSVFEEPVLPDGNKIPF